MKKLGLIGGLGPASTLDYYSLIIDGYKKVSGNDYPEFVIENVNMTEMLSYLNVNDYDGLTEFLRVHIDNLKNAGANFVAIASNTPHIVYDRLKRVSALPILSIVEATCAFAREKALSRVLVLGTKFTMTSGLYDKALPLYGITPILPSDEDKIAVHSCIFPKLEDGIVDSVDKVKMLSLINKYVQIYGVDGVLLGCTELPIMIKQSDLPDITVINTTEVHSCFIVKEMLS